MRCSTPELTAQMCCAESAGLCHKGAPNRPSAAGLVELGEEHVVRTRLGFVGRDDEQVEGTEIDDRKLGLARRSFAAVDHQRVLTARHADVDLGEQTRV